MLVLVSCRHLFAQRAVVRKNAILREEPSATSASQEQLNAGDKLTLLDATAEHGYYQVKTQDGKDGWVYSKSKQQYITVTGTIVDATITALSCFT